MRTNKADKQPYIKITHVHRCAQSSSDRIAFSFAHPSIFRINNCWVHWSLPLGYSYKDSDEGTGSYEMIAKLK
jgi:hypothetical protein